MVEQDYGDGDKAGTEWAKQWDNMPRILRLLELERKLGICTARNLRWFTESLTRPDTVAERMYFVLAPEDKGDCEVAERFWKPIAGTPVPSPEFVSGFFVGACLENLGNGFPSPQQKAIAAD